MWMIIGAIALFILYFVIKKNSNKSNTSETTLAQTSTTLEKTEKENTDETPVADTPVEEESAVTEKAVADSEKTPAPEKKVSPKKPAAKKPAAKKATPAKSDSSLNPEYADQQKTLSDAYKNAKEFTLFDTQAAFFWNDGDSTVTLLSITAFVKGAAKTNTYSTYSFNVTDWTWDGDQPKGCATEIKKHLSDNFKKGETA